MQACILHWGALPSPKPPLGPTRGASGPVLGRLDLVFGARRLSTLYKPSVDGLPGLLGLISTLRSSPLAKDGTRRVGTDQVYSEGRLCQDFATAAKSHRAQYYPQPYTPSPKYNQVRLS